VCNRNKFFFLLIKVFLFFEEKRKKKQKEKKLFSLKLSIVEVFFKALLEELFQW
jgi:hypothetical protein